MDKNQIIGFVLIFAVIVGWSIISAPSEAEIAEQKRLQDSIELVRVQAEQAAQESTVASTPQVETQLSDSLLNLQLQGKYGDFSTAAQGSNEIVSLENKYVKVNFQSKGGFIESVLLKEHFRMVENENGELIKEPLYLLQDDKNIFSYTLPLTNNLSGSIATGDLYFTPSKSGNSVTMSVNTASGRKFQQIYTLEEDGYGLDYSLNYAGLKSGEPIQLQWENYLEKLENNVTFESRYSTVYFKETEESNADYCNCAGDDEEDMEGESVDWVAHVNQYFNTALMADKVPFTDGKFETVMLTAEDEDLKLVKSYLSIPTDGSGNYAMNLYLGPNEYDRLAAYDNGFLKVIPYGNSIFGSINRHFVRPFFNFIGKYIGSLGIVIILVIFIIKMALYPLMYKMLHSQAKMGALKPELAGLKEKYKDDPQKSQMESMKVYREYGVSPFGGCMPMLMQMPIWYALFRYFPASISFRQESFLWATDLSSYDVITELPFTIPMFGSHISLFTILWAVTTVIYTYYNTKHMDLSANPAMKYVQYFMPIGFLVFFNSYASALTCYMFFSNLINIAQTIITKKFVFNDEKIRAELMAQKAKPKKKGGFQSRLEAAMKQQQEIQAKKQKGKGKR